MGRTDLELLSEGELIDLVLRLQQPAKTSRTSSKPPSTDRKVQRDKSRPGGAKRGHKGHSRDLSEDFDSAMDHYPDQCPGCGACLSAALIGEVVSEHDKIELPVVAPVVERHRRMAVTCPSCGLRGAADLPAEVTGTPFGPRLHAVATYLKTFQALSYERLEAAFADLFGLRISQGGLMNMLRRTQGRFENGRDAAVATLRRATVVASDDTGVRIEGSNAYHWVFRCEEAVVHQAAPTRGAVVVRDMMDGHRPEVWCSDRYVAYAIEGGEDVLPMRLKLWLHKAFGLARDIESLATSTIAARRRALERTLQDILDTPTSCELAKVVQNKFRRAKHQLLTFALWPGLVEPTNNACERALRPAVVQRKVTNGYRAMWAAQGEADIRTVIDTASLRAGANRFQTILGVVTA